TLQLLKLPHVQTILFTLLFIAFHELDDAVRLGKRQRAEKDAIDDGEDGGVRADTKCESQNGDDGEAGRPCQYTQTVSKVLPEGGHKAPRGRCGPPQLIPGPS